MKDVLLMMDLGTLNKMGEVEKTAGCLREFEGAKMIFTGWDFKGKGKLSAEKYDADVVVCESSILYEKPEQGWLTGEPRKALLFGETEKDKVKHANYEVMNQIYQRDEKAILLSQGNEVGVCYYINPPIQVFEKLKPFMALKEIAASEFATLLSKCGVRPSEIEVISPLAIRLPDNKENRYYVEKTNAMYRTFKPYRMKFGSGSIFLELDAEQKSEFTYSDLTEVVEQLWSRGIGQISLEEYLRIIPQDDICIDIFPRAKRETWREALRRTGLDRYRYSFYISAKTDSDIPFIVNGYHEKHFYALAPSDMSDGLRHAGVIPKANTMEQALSFISEVCSKES